MCAISSFSDVARLRAGIALCPGLVDSRLAHVGRQFSMWYAWQDSVAIDRVKLVKRLSMNLPAVFPCLALRALPYTVRTRRTRPPMVEGSTFQFEVVSSHRKQKAPARVLVYFSE